MADNPRNKTILVVDDDETICEFFQALLSKDGFNVVSAHNGNAALSLLKQSKTSPVSLIILDLMMPDPDGYKVLLELQEKLSEVPIVIATSRSLEKVTLEKMRKESNVKSFWQKPIHPRKFKQEIHRILGTAYP